MERWEKIIEKIELPTPEQHVFIWGAGNTSVLNHQGMLRENLYEELHVEAFLDSKLAGTKFNGFPVFHPDVLAEYSTNKVFIFISTTNTNVFREIESLCREKLIACCLLDAGILKLRKGRYQEAAYLLDEKSRLIYNAVLANRALAAKSDDLYAGESYFGIPEFCRCSQNDVIVDLGAYVGDSAERFIWRMEMFKKYIAIEPDSGNIQAMERRFQRLREEWNLPEDKLVAIHGGIDSATKHMSMNTRVDGLGSIASDADLEDGGVSFWALDDLIPEGCTFLKADIESFEYRMLCGARETIRKHHPRMAICIYHNMVDMYSIPLLIRDIDPSYHFAVRHHSYGYEETVLYAY